ARPASRWRGGARSRRGAARSAGPTSPLPAPRRAGDKRRRTDPASCLPHALAFEELLERERAAPPLRFGETSLEEEPGAEPGTQILGLDRERHLEVREVVVDEEPRPALGHLAHRFRVEHAGAHPGRHPEARPRRAPLVRGEKRVL